MVGDVGDADLLDEALVGVDLVCHQAAKVGLGVSVQDFPDYATDNVVGTSALLAAMDRAVVKQLVLASSMVVYGEGRYTCLEHGEMTAPPRRESDLASGHFDPACPMCGKPLEPGLVDESAVADPRNAYAATKLAQEQLSAAWARQCEGLVVALRYHNVYGPGMPKDTPYAGVASIFRSAIVNRQAPEVYEDGAQRRDFVHVRDVAAANLAAVDHLRSDEIASRGIRTFNVGSGQVHTVLDLATALSDALGGPAPKVTGHYRLGDVRHITASSKRIADELSWRASVSFEQGMTELARD